jgi:hypothetical protein
MSEWHFYKFNEIYDKDLKFKLDMIDKYTSKSNLQINNGKVYASGDLHGDYNLFMNILIDLSKMIKISNQEKYDTFRKTIKIDDMEKYLNSIKDKPIDIGLEWNGENKYIVFCGDLVDNKRGSFDIKIKYGENYVPFPEIKILYSIYYLNSLTNKNAIIKVCGNHDYGNLSLSSENRNWINNYAYVLEEENLYKNSRRDYFQYDLNLMTSRLLFHMIYPLVKINDHYFMHGGMDTEYFTENPDVEQINKDFIRCLVNKEPTCNLFDVMDGILWARSFSSEYFCTKEIPKDYNKIFEDKVIIVGHCSFISTIYDAVCDKTHKTNYKSIFPQRNKEDREIKEIKKKDVITSRFFNKYSLTCDEKNHGISAQFWDDKKDRVQLIRIDAAMGHGFDKDDIFNIDDDYNLDEIRVDNIGKEYYGRLPQILKISIDNKKSKYSVKTATVHNALINNKRGMFRNMKDNEIKEKTFKMNMINKDINYRKYMKYKMKYTQLKQMIGGYTNNL